MSEIANYEIDAKEKLYDVAEKIATKYKNLMDDGRLMGTDIYEMIAPCLNYLNRLMDEYNSLLGSNAVKLSFSDLFGETLSEEFRHYREDCGIVVDYEDNESFLPITERFPVTSHSDDEYWDAQWSKMTYCPKNTGKGFLQKIARSVIKLICPSRRGS